MTHTIEAAEAQVPLEQTMDAEQVKTARAHFETLWRKVERGTIWDRIGLGKYRTDYDDALDYEDERLAWLAAPHINVTFFPSESAQSMRVELMTLMELRDRIEGTSKKTKGALPWLKLARFSGERSEKNCLRHNKAVTAIHGVEADYDRGEMTLDAAIAIATKAKLRALLYTSASYTEKKPKWRIVLPTSKPLPPSERAKLMARVHGLYGGIFDPASFTLSQSYYFGSVKNNPKHHVVITKGDCIDLRSDLDADALGNDGQPFRAPPPHSNSLGTMEHFEAAPNDPYVVSGTEILAPLAKVKAALEAIPNDDTSDQSRSLWVNIGHAIKNTYPVEGRQLFNEWSATWVMWRDLEHYRTDEMGERYVLKTYDSFKPSGSITIATIFHFADQRTPGWRNNYIEAEAGNDKKKPFVITAKPHAFPDEMMIERRDFLYGSHLLRGTVSVSAGLGAVGKSGKSIVEALAMTTGAPLLNVRPSAPLRVLLVNLEDNRNEMDRRIAAVMKHYKLAKKDVGDRLITIAKGELKLKIAKQIRMGEIARDETVIKGLVDYLCENHIDVFSIDPLRKTHRVSENDNVVMGEVVECYEEIAEAANCAVHIWHHNRKGNSGETTIDSLRGASALVDAPRSAELLETMPEGVAEKFDIEPSRRRYYFRSFNGKVNFAPPIEASTWFELRSVILDNGDNMGVVTYWEPPKGKDLLTPEAIAAIKIAVKGGQWRENVRADMWVGKAIGKVLRLDPEKRKGAIKDVLKTLFETRVLDIKPDKDQHRKDVLFVVVA
jgi:AAA domain/Primase C terminal 2 (PriCT-2)